MRSLFLDVDEVNLKELPAESYFQDLQGNIYIGEGQQEQRACSHTYVNGTQHEHEKRGDSCTIYVYNAKTLQNPVYPEQMQMHFQKRELSEHILVCKRLSQQKLLKRSSGG